MAITFDDALDLVESAGVVNDTHADHETLKAAAALLDRSEISRDAAVLARVRRLVNRTEEYVLAEAMSRYWVLCELAIGNHDAVAEAIRTSPFPNRFYQGAIAAGASAWPLLLALVDRHDGQLVALAAALIDPGTEGGQERLSELCHRAPELAVRGLASTSSAPSAERLAPFLPLLRTPAGENVVYALRVVAEKGQSLEPIASSLDALSGLWARELAYAFTLSALRHAGDVSRYAQDARPAVRVGAVRALRHVKDKERLIPFAGDPDAEVRNDALAALATFTFDDADVARLVTLLDVAGDRLAGLLSSKVDVAALLAACIASPSPSAHQLAAGLRRVTAGAPTRACATCRKLDRHEQWSHDADEPAALAELHYVPAAPQQRRSREREESFRVLRCPTCGNCYEGTYFCEIDVNSRHEGWSLERLCLFQIRRDYGDDFAPDWTSALEADLDHPDPHWRAEAAHEITYNLFAAKDFDRIEHLLLRHPNVDVVRQTLRTLPFDAPVSIASLEAAARSQDEQTRALATRTLIVRRGPAALEDLEIRSPAEVSAVQNMLSRGAQPGPRLAAHVLERALATTHEPWEIDSLVRQTSFMPAHVAATLARLGAGIVDPMTRGRALDLCAALAGRGLLKGEALALVVQHGLRSELPRERMHALDAAIASMAHTQLPAVANEMLLRGSETQARLVVQHLSAAHSRQEDVLWAVPALGKNVVRYRESYEAAQLLWQLAKSGVDLTVVARELNEALTVVSAYSAEAAARALVHHHLRRGDVDAVLSVLGHRLPYVRGAAAAALAELKEPPPPPILDRLEEMTKDRSRKPRDNAAMALQLLSKRRA